MSERTEGGGERGVEKASLNLELVLLIAGCL